MLNLRLYGSILIALALTACASSSKNYYSLNENTDIQPLASVVDSNIKAVQLNLKYLPQKLNRPQLIVYDTSISPKVHVLNDSLWVSALPEQIRNVVAIDIATYLNVPSVTGLNYADNIKFINLSIDNFDMHLGKGTNLKANWQEKFNQKTAVCAASIQTKPETSADVAGLVVTQNDAIHALAALIVLQDAIKGTEIYKKIVSYDVGCT